MKLKFDRNTIIRIIAVILLITGFILMYIRYKQSSQNQEKPIPAPSSEYSNLKNILASLEEKGFFKEAVYTDKISQNSESLGKLSNLGIKTYLFSMQFAWIDIDGGGEKKLAVAGCDKYTVISGKLVINSGLAIYKLGEGKPEVLYEKKEDVDIYFTGLKALSLNNDGKMELLSWWSSGGSGGFGHTLVTYKFQNKIIDFRLPSGYPAKVEDTDNDGIYELWLNEAAAGSTCEAYKVFLPKPYQWIESDLMPVKDVSSKFKTYYLDDYIPKLEKEIQNNPYDPAIPLREAYRADRLKAIGLARKIIK